eukprot:s2745_g4.t1
MKRLQESYTMPGKLRQILNLERQIAVVQLLLETAIEVEDWLEYQEFDHIVPPMLKAGCYRRNEGGHSGFSAICRQCDADKIVCPLCLEGGFDWDSGHRAYIEAHGEEDQEVIEVSVDPSDPPVRIRLSDLAASAGISVEKLRSELFASLGGSGLQGR